MVEQTANLEVSEAQAEGVEPLSQDQRDTIQKNKEEDWGIDHEEIKDDTLKPKVEEKPDKPEDKPVDEEPKKEEEKPDEEEKPAEEEEPADPDAETDEARVAKIAQKEGLTVEEVIANEAKDKQIAERHGNEPAKIARALRMEQSEYGKLQNEVKELKQFKQTAQDQQSRLDEKFLNDYFEKNREKMVETFSEKRPEEAEGLSDDAIFERARSYALAGIKKQQEDKAEQQEKDATDKKEKLIKALSEEFNEHIPAIKENLEKIKATEILKDDFDVSFLAMYERGKKYTPDYVKSLLSEAKKKAKEGAKIVSPKGGKPSESKAKISNLNAQEKERALEIYGRRDGWTKDRMYEEYTKNDKGKDDW